MVLQILIPFPLIKFNGDIPLSKEIFLIFFYVNLALDEDSQPLANIQFLSLTKNRDNKLKECVILYIMDLLMIKVMFILSFRWSASSF